MGTCNNIRTNGVLFHSLYLGLERFSITMSVESNQAITMVSVLVLLRFEIV